MEGDRKYRQNGYQDSSRETSHSGPRREDRQDRPRPQGPRPPLDITGPRLPRLVQSVTASRCYNCSATLGPGTDFRGNCPKCGTALHCCKQCSNFEPSTRFQCLKPIPARIAAKDQANECELFKPRVTVARDAAHSTGYGSGYGSGTNGSSEPPANGNRPNDTSVPRSASDARAAFDNLFRKTD
jgi:hypothetical protein